jgi:hypothetical protein
VNLSFLPGRVLKVGLLLLAMVACLTALATSYRRTEVDVIAYGFPFAWLVRIPPDATHLDRASFIVRWSELAANLKVYTLVAAPLLAAAILLIRLVRRRGVWANAEEARLRPKPGGP